MKDRDYYSKLGFKCGLEIHQRLETETKLYCNCNTRLTNENAIKTIERRQRAVAGELGFIDSSTKFESQKERKFIYHAYRESTCLVDLDEEPPGNLNNDALETAMLISRSFDCYIPDEIEPMRKSVVDGSDPSSFQRTMLCGYEGEIEVDGMKIPIPSVFLEEESSSILHNSASEVVYGADRLGIPLIEVDTDPVIPTPQDAKKVAMKIGLLLRLTKKVQRGIGSIRQDVNISIRNGARIEIKGFQDIDSMDEIIENEVERQKKLIEISEELKKRNASVGKPVDLTRIFKHTEAKILSDYVWQGGSVLGAKLEGFKGLIGMEIGPMTRLGSEISEYAKTAEVKGIIHSDENLENYKISKIELEGIKDALALGENDSFVLVAERKDRCEKAIEFALMRARMAIDGVPAETRAANSKNKTTRFLRPIPGGLRMYPETDALPAETKKIAKKLNDKKIDIEAIRKKLEHEIRNKQIAEQMLWSKELSAYEEIISRIDVEPILVASVLLEKFRELSRSGVNVDSISLDSLVYIFSNYAKKKITKLGIEEILKSSPKERWEVDRIIKERNLSRMHKAELKRLVLHLKDKPRNEIIREVMSKYRLIVGGEELQEAIKNMGS